MLDLKKNGKKANYLGVKTIKMNPKQEFIKTAQAKLYIKIWFQLNIENPDFSNSEMNATRDENYQTDLI